MRTTQTHTATVYGNGQINVPVGEIEVQEIEYSDEVQVVLPELGDSDETVMFRRYVTGGYKLTIPARIRRAFGLTGESVAVEVEATGNKWTPDEPTQTRGGNRTDTRTL